MDPPPSQGPPYSNVRQHLFHSPHLPPPSQLHLPPVSSSRSNIINTLPPLNPPNRMSAYRHSSPPPSSWSTPLHRTSSSREDILPSSHPSVHQNTSEPRQFKREQLQQPPPPPPPPPPPAPPQTQKDSDDNMPATSDFVKKLYKMLEDQSFSHVVSWGPNGDCFVVKDMNEFTKSILPRMFKHSNFASFVRQLNKYDFHKVKNTDDSQFGEHSWTFKHPDFHADRRDALENIKRKVPAARKSAPSGSGIGPSTLGRSGSAGSPGPLGLQNSLSGFQSATSGLRQQVTALQSQNDSLRTQLGRSEDRVRGLERCYKDVLGEMVHFQRNLAQQDALMQSLVQYFLRSEGGESVYFFWFGFCLVRPAPCRRSQAGQPIMQVLSGVTRT
ncbi:HSF-type DNA-binding-domain-containing protein [Pisolithus marmoratus]|nr:HSF-type DNA-binding-domain-containing protein [Pisolithus marmoratus]